MTSPVGDLITDTAAVLGSYWHATLAIGFVSLAALALASGLHYLAAATAARAASGVDVPFGELTLAQLAASAANRITPAGLGGSAVVARYLHRRGALSLPQASAAVAALAVFGGVSDALGLLAIIAIAAATGSATGGLSVALHRLAGMVPHPSSTVVAVLASIASLVVLGCVLQRRRIGARLRDRTAAIGRGVRSFASALGSLVRRPARAATLIGASGGTTLVLSAGFAAAATLPAGGLPVASFAAVMIGFMVASAAGNAVPTPGGVGTVDAAQVAVLVGFGAPLATSVATVIAFRVITFWLPAAVGVGAARVLRRRGAL